MMNNINKIKKLIKAECAGYFTEQYSIHHYCCNMDGACLFFGDIENPDCKYFEKSILPLDIDLEHEYRKERKIDTLQIKQAKPRIKCERCKDIFSANSNRQKHCEKCSKIIKREQDKKRQQRRRDNSYSVTH